MEEPDDLRCGEVCEAILNPVPEQRVPERDQRCPWATRRTRIHRVGTQSFDAILERKRRLGRRAQHHVVEPSWARPHQVFAKACMQLDPASRTSFEAGSLPESPPTDPGWNPTFEILTRGFEYFLASFV
jgi:hypothetical protein